MAERSYQHPGATTQPPSTAISKIWNLTSFAAGNNALSAANVSVAILAVIFESRGAMSEVRSRLDRRSGLLDIKRGKIPEPPTRFAPTVTFDDTVSKIE